MYDFNKQNIISADSLVSIWLDSLMKALVSQKEISFYRLTNIKVACFFDHDLLPFIAAFSRSFAYSILLRSTEIRRPFSLEEHLCTQSTFMDQVL